MNIDAQLLCVCLCVCTLPCHYNTSHAVWDAGACCEEGDAHDDIRNSQSEANHGHLKQNRFGPNTTFISGKAAEENERQNDSVALSVHCVT